MYVLIYAIIFIIILAFMVTSVQISNILTVLLLLVAVITLIVVFRRNVALGKHNFNKYDERLLIIQNVQKGGVIRVHNVEGQSYSLDLKVVNRNLYMEGDYSWYELECVNSNGDKFWIEVDDDDELVISMVIKKLRISDIKFSSSLDLIDDNESGNVVYDGTIYNYEDSADAVYYKHCDDRRPQELYYWDFKCGNKLVSVERWGTDFEYFYSQIIPASDIEVYSTKGAQR